MCKVNFQSDGSLLTISRQINEAYIILHDYTGRKNYDKQYLYHQRTWGIWREEMRQHRGCKANHPAVTVVQSQDATEQDAPRREVKAHLLLEAGTGGDGAAQPVQQTEPAPEQEEAAAQPVQQTEPPPEKEEAESAKSRQQRKQDEMDAFEEVMRQHQERLKAYAAWQRASEKSNPPCLCECVCDPAIKAQSHCRCMCSALGNTLPK